MRLGFAGTLLLTQYRKHGTSFTSHDLLKCLAILLMVIDHIGHFFLPDSIELRAIGRWCVPIWFFFVGYASQQSLRWGMVIGIILLISADYLYAEPIFPLTILATIICCRLLLRWLDKGYLAIITPTKIAAVSGIALLWGLLSVLVLEYGSIGFLLALGGFILSRYEEVHALWIKLYLAAVALLYGASEIVFFDMQWIAASLTIVGVIGVTVALYYYRFVVLVQHPNSMLRIAAYIGRNSLAVYVLHFLLFLVVKATFL